MQSSAQQRSGKGACHITKLPYELVLAVAHWTEHPGDIVSLSLASRYFYRVLVLPPPSLPNTNTNSATSTNLPNNTPTSHAEVAWRQARERMRLITGVDKLPPDPRLSDLGKQHGTVRIRWEDVPIPAPYQGMREADLMIILFGPKLCCVCGRTFSDAPLMIGVNEFYCKDCKIETHLITKSTARGDLDDNDPSMNILFDAMWTSLPRIEAVVFQHYLIASASSRSRTSERAWNAILGKFTPTALATAGYTTKEFIMECLTRTDLIQPRVQHTRTLNDWLEKYYKHVGYINAAFKASGEIWARSHNIEMEDLQKAPPYRHLTAVSMRGRILSIDELLTPSIENEILDAVSKIHTNRVGRTVAKAVGTRRADISALYQQHHFQNKVKPSWSTFRSIPIIKAMQNSFAPTGVKIERESSRYSYDATEVVSDKIGISRALRFNGNLDLLDVAVAKWRVEAVKGARQLLGYDVGGLSKSKKRRTKKERQRWKMKKEIIRFMADVQDTMEEDDDDHTDNQEEGDDEEDAEQATEATTSAPPVTAPAETMEADSTKTSTDLPTQKKIYQPKPGKLDPEMRVTTWFSCTKCHTYDSAYKRLKVLDFKGMCSHECVQKDKKKKDRPKWNIRNFALAHRAIATTRKMLEVLGLEEDDPQASQAALNAQKWICNNCPPTVRTLYWEDLIRHCLRHPSQDVSAASKEQEEERAKLPDSRRAPCSFADLVGEQYKKEAMTEQFGCVHCHPSILTRNIGATEGKSGEKKTKAMKFHGMRQHMKAKHGLEDVRNEDFYFLAEGLFERAEPMDDDVNDVPTATSTKGKKIRFGYQGPTYS